MGRTTWLLWTRWSPASPWAKCGCGTAERRRFRGVCRFHPRVQRSRSDRPGRDFEILPKRLRVFGIEGRRFDVGSGISPEVVSATEEVAKRIAGENSTRSTAFNANPILTFNAE